MRRGRSACMKRCRNQPSNLVVLRRIVPTALPVLEGAPPLQGRLQPDPVGDAFIADLQAANVHFAGRQAQDGPATARSMIFVTPDTIRSMNTFLGSSLHLNADHLSNSITAKYIYLEGYLFDAPKGPEIFQKAAEIVAATGGKLRFHFQMHGA